VQPPTQPLGTTLVTPRSERITTVFYTFPFPWTDSMQPFQTNDHLFRWCLVLKTASQIRSITVAKACSSVHCKCHFSQSHFCLSQSRLCHHSGFLHGAALSHPYKLPNPTVIVRSLPHTSSSIPSAIVSRYPIRTSYSISYCEPLPQLTRGPNSWNAWLCPDCGCHLSGPKFHKTFLSHKLL
jgi:hypothetical protein